MKLLRYLYAYFKNDTPALRDEASAAAREWLVAQGWTNGHYADAYQQEYKQFVKAYINSALHVQAKRYVLLTEKNKT